MSILEKKFTCKINFYLPCNWETMFFREKFQYKTKIWEETTCLDYHSPDFQDCDYRSVLQIRSDMLSSTDELDCPVYTTQDFTTACSKGSLQPLPLTSSKSTSCVITLSDWFCWFCTTFFLCLVPLDSLFSLLFSWKLV